MESVEENGNQNKREWKVWKRMETRIKGNGKCGREWKNLQTFEYLQNKKSFYDEIKNIFYNFLRIIIWWKNKNLIKISGRKLEVVWSKWKCRHFHSGKMGVDGEDGGYWICGVIEVFFSNFFLAKIWRLLNKFDCPISGTINFCLEVSRFLQEKSLRKKSQWLLILKKPYLLPTTTTIIFSEHPPLLNY